MSKHLKEVRRERRKVDRARRFMARFRHPTSHIPHGAAALAAAAVIAAGTSAYATPVRHDNPPGAGHFDWTVDTTWLDITLPASSQPGVEFDETSVWQGGTSVGGDHGTAFKLQVGGVGDFFLVGVDAGVLIPSGTPWDRVGLIYYSGYGSELPEGQATYLGVQFDPGMGLQYGWIGVERTGLSVDAFAWGYETEVGVSIPAGAPEPGTLAMLALGALGVIRRRR